VLFCFWINRFSTIFCCIIANTTEVIQYRPTPEGSVAVIKALKAGIMYFIWVCIVADISSGDDDFLLSPSKTTFLASTFGGTNSCIERNYETATTIGIIKNGSDFVTSSHKSVVGILSPPLTRTVWIT